MSSLRWVLLGVVAALMACCAVGPAMAQQETDVVTLHDGTVFRGKIIELIPDQLVRLETPGGHIVELEWKAVRSLSKEGGQAAVHDALIDEIRLAGYQTRKMIDLVGLTLAYGITIAADLAAGGEFYWGSAVPVIGPFIAMGQVDEIYYFDPDDAAGDRTLFFISGLVQLGFAGDYWWTSKREDEQRRRATFSCTPEGDGVRLAVAWTF